MEALIIQQLAWYRQYLEGLLTIEDLQDKVVLLLADYYTTEPIKVVGFKEPKTLKDWNTLEDWNKVISR